ncbi:fluoride efflux transporter CrcB [Thalassotalea eurytherma]|uniref:Fluoride-specific ion channel FluC n=1 Tax=Thalassotalea eurytherma TaxID=1144278 RepID=A0ABQ6H427_9GAMM|nr:fluoride efflux transporter CrcB [Thalassotalea eurytherma]GLX82264.1 putative fluoride ion transporter CrcB [Thalassotalea eurytherma]
MTNGINSYLLYLTVALGGGIGASLRFFVYQQTASLLGKGFPYATLLVNLLGSFLLGLLYSLIEQGHIEAGVYRSLIGIGFLGAFTTFSTFSVDTILLFQQGFLLKAMTNIVLNVSLCIMAAALGMFIVTLINK